MMQEQYDDEISSPEEPLIIDLVPELAIINLNFRTAIGKISTSHEEISNVCYTLFWNY
jgi:hypothetical protein